MVTHALPLGVQIYYACKHQSGKHAFFTTTTECRDGTRQPVNVICAVGECGHVRVRAGMQTQREGKGKKKRTGERAGESVSARDWGLEPERKREIQRGGAREGENDRERQREQKGLAPSGKR